MCFIVPEVKKSHYMCTHVEEEPNLWNVQKEDSDLAGAWNSGPAVHCESSIPLIPSHALPGQA